MTNVDLPAGRALNLGTASAALVYDNSLSGATGPDPGPALPAGGEPDVRLAELRGSAGGLPAVLHAGASLHPRRPHHALRPLRVRWRGATGCSRSSWALPGWCAAIAMARSAPPNARPAYPTRPPARSSTSCWAAAWSWQPGAPVPAVRRAGRRVRLLRGVAARTCRLRRRRAGLGQRRQAQSSAPAPATRCSAPARVFGSTCLASRWRRSIWFVRSSGRKKGGCGS